MGIRDAEPLFKALELLCPELNTGIRADVGVVWLHPTAALPARWERRRTRWTNCTLCNGDFGFWNRMHHCRTCGVVVCGSCCGNRAYLPAISFFYPVRICMHCDATRK